MQVYKIDKKGYYIKPVVMSDDETPMDCIEIQPPDGLYRAKWTGFEWVEDMTQKEIEELNNKPNVPTEKERIDMLENMILLMMEG